MILQRPLWQVASITMGTSPKGDTYNQDGSGLPLLNGPTEFGATYPNCTLFTTDSKRECRPGDLIFCVRGSTTGRMNWADRIYSLGRGVCSIRGETASDTQFIKYCLDWKLEALLKYAGGGTFPNLTQDTIRDFEIPFHEHRRKIAAILSVYDDLIENNLRRIKILEEMAENLYREWFVKFRFPSHKDIPLVDSPLEQIPQGWKVVNFGDLYMTSSGGTPSRAVTEYYGGDHPWVKTRELNDGFILETEETISDLGLKKSSAKIFPENTVILAIYGATIGKLGILSIPSATNQACVAILPKEAAFGRAFAFLFLRENRDKLIGLGQGAAQQNISQVVLKNFPSLRPPVSLVHKFSEIVELLLDNIRNLQLKNTNLSRTRDLLLPKLISGELDVSELDIAIPEEDAA